MSTTNSSRRSGRRISIPAIVLGLVVGLVMAGAAFLSDRLWLAVAFLGIMAVFVVFIVVASRFSDTVALLGDDIHEERHVHLHQRASLYTLNILGLVLIGGGVVDIARGGDGNPWALLCFVAAVVYVACLVILNRRG
jgi:4-hydroxybenzoate polyprenyltransferase